jgi:pimeloyl-ACP methyl ester carboxylesterase
MTVRFVRPVSHAAYLSRYLGFAALALFLIAAPFVGEGGWPSDELASSADLGARLAREMPVHIFHGLEDETAPPAHAELYARAVPQARVHRLPGRDHQLNDDLTDVALVIKALDGQRGW